MFLWTLILPAMASHVLYMFPRHACRLWALWRSHLSCWARASPVSSMPPSRTTLMTLRTSTPRMSTITQPFRSAPNLKRLLPACKEARGPVDDGMLHCGWLDLSTQTGGYAPLKRAHSCFSLWAACGQHIDGASQTVIRWCLMPSEQVGALALHYGARHGCLEVELLSEGCVGTTASDPQPIGAEWHLALSRWRSWQAACTPSWAF